jgi:two-component system sensor histidine kinase ChvG
MRLRGQLLFAGLIVALLPISAVLFLKPVEHLLRSGHEQAMAESARTAAALLAESGLTIDATDDATDDRTRDGDPAAVLYLHPPSGRRLLDGYADDWRSSLDRIVRIDGDRVTSARADELEEGGDPVRLAAILDGRMLELYLRVQDGSPGFATTRGEQGDAVHLTLSDADGARRFVLAPTAPGPIALRDSFGRLLRGHWQDRPDGWSLELRTLVNGPVTKVALDVIDRSDGEVLRRHTTGALTPLGRLDKAEQRLERLGIGPAWWVDQGGWVRAHASGGVIGRDPDAADATPGNEQGALDFLMAARMDELPIWSRRSVRLASTAIEAVLSGGEGAEWGRVGSERSIRVRYAVPVGQQGALVIERDAGPLLLVANRAVLSWLGATFLLFMLLALLLFGFALLLAVRIRRLKAATERAVGESGRLEALPEASTARDELGDLSRGLRGLLLRLREHQRYLQSLADSLAHELRTPVSMVQSSLENLEAAKASEQPVYLERAGQGARRLRRIVQAMSQASRLEESLQREPRRPMDLARLVRDYCDVRNAALPLHRLHAELDAGLRAPIEGAEDLLAQLLDKIVDNAVDFTPDHGRITLGVHAEDGGWLLWIENEGVPIDPEQASAAFDSMVTFRTSKRRDDGAPHLGLGLYVARCIVQFHEGRIWAQPTDRGTRVEVWLPACNNVFED